MALSSNDDELTATVRGLTKNQLMALATQYSTAYLEQFFDQIKETIAQEAQNRIKSKIALYFNAGYATGALFDSIYYVIKGNYIQLKSSKSYFNILNTGFDSFDMKASRIGKRMKMRLPGGRIIWRVVGDQNDQDNARKKSYSTKNWIHPGYQGKHIFQLVEEEMRAWMKHYIQEQVWMLLSTVPDIPYAKTQSGYMYYSKRNNLGQFQ